jgi:hypothetical protein
MDPNDLELININKGKEAATDIAERLWSVPVFLDIAKPKDRESSQPKQHYLSTIIVTTTK